MTSAPATQRTDDQPPVWQRRRARRSKELVGLLERRPELWGVYGPADVAVEFVLWSA